MNERREEKRCGGGNTDQMVRKAELTIYYSGRYGERIAVSQTSADEYIVACDEADIEKATVNKEGLDALISKYVDEGVRDFDKTDLESKKRRAIEMGRRLQRYYKSYRDSFPDQLECFRYASDISRIMADVTALELTDDQYEQWFVRVGWNQTDEATEEYVQFILDAKKLIIEKHK